MLKTAIMDLLNIQVPVVQGAMAWIADASLAAGVSRAGGLGIIAAGNAPAEYVKQQILEVQSQTDRPFGVNIMLLSPSAPEIAQLCTELHVPVVTTGAGDPSKYMEMWKQAGIKVLPVIPSVAYARRMEKLGADAVIAEGCEAGGHIGELTSMALVPQVVDAVNIPVIGAGGVGDGRGLAAMLMLGAEGVQVGTRFLVAKECTVHQNYKDKILAAKDTDTIVTGRSTGHPVRAIKNKLSREFKKLESQGASFEEIEALGAGGLQKAAKQGDVVYGSVMSGQIAGLVKEEQTCQQIITSLVEQAEQVIAKGAAKWEN